ncbi:hypothetical protein GQ543_11815, partial [candidate division WOR-3 bacterium]|nr:hypothetical protein [candidate division WOR-3 bacterium]
EEEKSYDPDWQVKSLQVLPNPFVCSACVPGYEQEYFVLWNISGTRVGTYQGNCIGTDLASGIYFLRPVDSSEKPIQIIKLR